MILERYQQATQACLHIQLPDFEMCCVLAQSSLILEVQVGSIHVTIALLTQMLWLLLRAKS